MAEAWKIQRRLGACSVCERSFEDGERHISTISVVPESEDGEPHALARHDLCLPCWRKRREDAEVSVDDLFWWATRFLAERKRTVAMDLPSLEKLFVELEGRDELRVRELRYVLCLLLMRKRRVKVERVIRGSDGESFLVKRPRRDERYTVHVFDFEPERMQEIRDELQAIFDGAESEEGIRIDALEEENGAGDSAEDSTGDPETSEDISETAAG